MNSLSWPFDRVQAVAGNGYREKCLTMRQVKVSQTRTMTLPQAAATLPHPGKTVAQICLASWLIALAAQITVPMSVVPMSMQSMAVLAVGLCLSPRRALASVLAYLGQGALGLPVFAGAMGGMVHLMGPRAGYLWLYPVLVYALATAWRSRWAQRWVDCGTLHAVVLSAGLLLPAVIVLLLGGAAWLSMFTGVKVALFIGVAPFIGLELAKIGCLALMVGCARHSR